MTVSVTTDDFATYKGLPALSSDQEDRVQMLLDAAVKQALAVVTVGTVPDTGATEANLPDGAEAVIYEAVGRPFLNPAGVTTEAVGIASYTRPIGSGSMLSAAERAELRRLAGGGGAFSYDLIHGYPDSVFSDDDD